MILLCRRGGRSNRSFRRALTLTLVQKHTHKVQADTRNNPCLLHTTNKRSEININTHTGSFGPSGRIRNAEKFADVICIYPIWNFILLRHRFFFSFRFALDSCCTTEDNSPRSSTVYDGSKNSETHVYRILTTLLLVLLYTAHVRYLCFTEIAT